MPVALICCREDAGLEADLKGTVLWRREFMRFAAAALGTAQTMAAKRPDITLVDRDVEWALPFLRWVRGNDAIRGISIAVLARGEVDPAEMEMLEAGANAILRLPAGPEWDKRLTRLIHVAIRREIRFPVFFKFGAAPMGGWAPIRGVTLNISETGMLIECGGLEIGSEVHFAFQLPGRTEVIRGRARVSRQAAPGQFGLEFSELAGEYLEQILGFVKSTQGS